MKTAVSSDKTRLERDFLNVALMTEQADHAVQAVRFIEKSGVDLTGLKDRIDDAVEVLGVIGKSGVDLSGLAKQIDRASRAALEPLRAAAALRVTRAFDMSGIADQLCSARNVALKPLSDAMVLTIPKLSFLENHAEQIRPVLEALAAVGEQMRPLAPSLLGQQALSSEFSSRWLDHFEAADVLDHEPARSSDHQVVPADSAIEWPKELHQALATFFLILMAIAVVAACGARTEIAAVDGFMVAAQILFYGIPYAVLKNPLLSSIWFWVPIYWFVRRRE